MSEVKAKYPSTQVELYAIEKLSIDNLEFDLGLFAAENTNYNSALITSIRALRAAAMALPNEEQRNGVHQILGNKLPGLLIPIKKDFNILKQLIIDAWPGEEPKPRWESAGLNNYNNIGEKNWEQVVELNNLMTAFITDVTNAAKLATPGGMVAGFPAQVASNFTKFNDVYAPFLTSRETATARAAKITADNKLYEACSKFRNFGVTVVFANDDANKKRYTFTALKDIISPPGSSSMTVGAKKGDDNPILDAIVTIKKDGLPAVVERIEAGAPAVFLNLPDGDYAGDVDVAGVKTNFTKTVPPGTDSRVTVVVP
ncbi:MAG: hypothetical protein ABI855_00075 [Bacteroidota bacterium]